MFMQYLYTKNNDGRIYFFNDKMMLELTNEKNITDAEVKILALGYKLLEKRDLSVQMNPYRLEHEIEQFKENQSHLEIKSISLNKEKDYALSESFKEIIGDLIQEYDYHSRATLYLKVYNKDEDVMFYSSLWGINCNTEGSSFPG